MSQLQLFENIIKISEAKTFELAREEWFLTEIYWSSGSICLCGHNPIKELCELTNIKNGNKTIVGNCCVNKFMELPSNLIFDAIKRIKQDISKGVNSETIKFAFAKDWINEWEHKFYEDTFRKRILSEKQQYFRIKINKKIISEVNKLILK